MLTAIVPPSIDALSPKNQEMGREQVLAILRHTGLLAEDRRDGAEAVFTRPEGGTGRVERRCAVISEGFLPTPETPLVVQVSRWDRLKDPVGVMRGFAAAAPGDAPPHLILAGPASTRSPTTPTASPSSPKSRPPGGSYPTPSATGSISPACRWTTSRRTRRSSMPCSARRRSIVQKSLKEGFGLTVTEAMWKARPVIASATGGIRDQIADGVTGLLLHDPFDLDAFARAIAELLAAPERARQIGRAAHESVRASFLENRHTLQYVDLLGHLLAK